MREGRRKKGQPVTGTDRIDKYRDDSLRRAIRTYMSFVRPNCLVGVIKDRALGVSHWSFLVYFPKMLLRWDPNDVNAERRQESSLEEVFNLCVEIVLVAARFSVSFS